MKIFLYVLSALLFATCSSTQTGSTAAVVPSPPTVKSNVSKDDFSNADRIGQIMNYLASDELKGRDSGSEGIEKAAQYIENHFKAYGVTPYFESYRDTLSNFKKPSYNVVGVVEGNDPTLKNEFIVIGAHYDHIGIVEMENGDAIANGANDNASGTTSVLEFARYFGTNKTNKRTLIFALFSAEEKGLLGAKHLAKKLKEADLNLYTMLNFEMTGVPMQDKDYFMYITGYEMSNLAAVGNTYAKENLIGFLPTAQRMNLYQRSDNYAFHQEFGVPSHTFCTFDFTNFDHYHKVGDEPEIMDFAHMAQLVNKTIPVLEGIANAPAQEVQLTK
ncbi:M28 family metallopeptidase [Flagellimonas zhangzhouensis]|uniref:Peptidase family M28 n=1 Tax=Flagellimonas zhangzhouensis TaxID=1073328 RepID=A0A1H2Q2L9_9FLAO|nr:M28 family peptidase [Allomuricauda zhangzhouensis]SDQ47278.1 Peptidase family M28 [Allomuricauda zhangzhouensis]SDW01385.1 Peptidase family M28 [Allomuricauda zhangzhouensis]